MRQGELIQIPMLRLGANAYIEKALQAAHELLFSYFDKPFDKAMKQRLTQAEQAVIEHFAVIRDQLRAYEEAIQNREQRESLQEVFERTLKLVTITVCTARPGIIIGKGGQEVDKLFYQYPAFE